MARGNQREIARQKAEKKKHEKGVVSLLFSFTPKLEFQGAPMGTRSALQTSESDPFKTVADALHRVPRTQCQGLNISVRGRRRQRL